jgi:hypothetical protein
VRIFIAGASGVIGFEAAPPEPPRIHVADAARQTVPAIGCRRA